MLSKEGLEYIIPKLRPYYRKHMATQQRLQLEVLHGMRDIQGAAEGGYNYISPFYKYFGIKYYRNLRTKSYWMEDKWHFMVPNTWRFDGAIENVDLKQKGHPTELNRLYIYSDKTFEYSYTGYNDKEVNIELTREFRNGPINNTWKKFEPYVNQDMLLLRTGHGNCITNKGAHQTVILEIPWAMLPSNVHYWRVGIYGGLPGYAGSWRSAKILIHHSKTKLTRLPAGETLEVNRIGNEYQYSVTGDFQWITGHPSDDQKYQNHTMKLERPTGMSYTYVALEVDAEPNGYDGSIGLLFNLYVRDDLWETVTRFDDNHTVIVNKESIPKMYSGINQLVLRKHSFPSWPHFGDKVTLIEYVNGKNVVYKEYMCTGPSKEDNNMGVGYWHNHTFIHPYETNETLIKGYFGESDNPTANQNMNMMARMRPSIGSWSS